MTKGEGDQVGGECVAAAAAAAAAAVGGFKEPRTEREKRNALEKCV